ncbi:hypothetical protein AXX16_0658 [Serratia rubidaea]|nr:hypothetical protein AXX16_0658 [Serratia rubidaea]
MQFLKNFVFADWLFAFPVAATPPTNFIAEYYNKITKLN